MKQKLQYFVILFTVACTPCFGISVYKGIQPGKSTRDDVAAVFGQSINNVSAKVFEYAMATGQGKLYIEYRDDSAVVDRIERSFPKPVSRAALIKSLGLPDTPEEKEIKDGRLIEYFGGLKILSLTYSTVDNTSGVRSLSYYSFEMYDRMLYRAQNPTVQFDPAACRDLYFWSQTERALAKRTKDTARHQAVLEIQIVSQRGECEKARKLVEIYKQRY